MPAIENTIEPTNTQRAMRNVRSTGAVAVVKALVAGWVMGGTYAANRPRDLPRSRLRTGSGCLARARPVHLGPEAGGAAAGSGQQLFRFELSEGVVVAQDRPEKLAGRELHGV